jgi:hypothetical protein
LQTLQFEEHTGLNQEHQLRLLEFYSQSPINMEMEAMEFRMKDKNDDMSLVILENEEGHFNSRVSRADVNSHHKSNQCNASRTFSVQPSHKKANVLEHPST